jgi:hypothetical protein
MADPRKSHSLRLALRRWRGEALTLAVGVAVVLSAAALGCGGSDEDGAGSAPPQPPEPLTPAERATVIRAEREVGSFCRQVARALVGERSRLTQAEVDRVFGAIDRFAAIAREKPGAELQAGTDVRLALGDIAENLEGSNCYQPLVDHIDEALATIR